MKNMMTPSERPMTLLHRGAIVIAILSLCTFLPAQQNTADRAELSAEIESFLAAHHALDQFCGATLVAEDGEIVYQGAFGVANADWKIPNGVDTKFRLGSLTKQFTAMLVLLLVEEGKLALDAPISTYLPDYTAESGAKVTIHHLLRHTSGIPNYTARRDFDKDKLHRLPVAEFVAKFCSDPLEFEPGTQCNYSNSGYFLLGAIVEAVTGKTYAEALRARVLDPLGLDDTGFDDQNAVLENRATGYWEFLGERRLAQWLDVSNAYAAGGLYSTVQDLWKWDRALCAKTLLSGELEERMFTPGLDGYGDGWGIDLDDPDAPRILHSGGISGFVTRIVRVPARGRCVVVLSNSGEEPWSPTVRSEGSPVRAIASGIEGILEGNEPEPPARSTELSLAHVILEGGVEAGLSQFEDLPSSKKDAGLELRINSVGYSLLARGRVDDALRVFTFNTRAYPESANTWDSLGEGYAEAGDRERAIENYRKALTLDPESESAKAMLLKLGAQPLLGKE